MLELPKLEQRHWDLIGLALVAFAAFFACVFYLGWAGGRVGEVMADGILFLFGAVGYLAPVALFAVGALLVVRPMMPGNPSLQDGRGMPGGRAHARPGGRIARARPGDTPRDGFLDPSYLREHGGLVGESLFWVAAKLFSEAGAHILFVFLMLAAVLLLTGASIAGVVQAGPSEPRPRPPSACAAAPPARSPRRLPRRSPKTASRSCARLTWRRRRSMRRSDEPEPDPYGGARTAHEEPETLPERPEPEPVELTPMGNRRSNVTEADDLEYRMPKESFLKRSNGAQKVDTKGIERTGAQLTEALSHFNVEGRVIGTVTGPHVTRYELRMAPGVKMSKVAQLKDDLAYALAADQVRILAPIPGKQAVGVEVPNRVRKMVHLGDVFQEAPKGWSPLSVWLGKDIAGKAIGTDLAKQPHILIAGTTGSGKSGCVNAMLSSVLLRSDPNEVRMVLVDPKRVELNHYEGIPHLLTPVVTSPRLAANVLGNLIKEMEERYGVMSRTKTRNLVELNRVRAKQGERPLPYILCVIDELADLMMVAPADVEDSIIRLAQKSRAVGIHLVLATQRPSADVITGMIKANVPARIAFAVSSQTDSRVILDQNGAESLLGQGDMLFRPAGESRSARIQGAFITEEEIERLTEFWRRQGEPELHEELLEATESDEEGEGSEGDFDPDQDDLLGDAVATVVQMGTASTSMLQRRLRVGYTRAGRLIDMMERRGVISGYEGSKARQVLITEADLPRVLEALAEPAVGAAADDPQP